MPSEGPTVEPGGTGRGGKTVDDANERAQTCPDCQALVADLQAHERWHSRLVADLARAVEKEIKRSASPAG
jgi:hypothetical protein